MASSSNRCYGQRARTSGVKRFRSLIPARQHPSEPIFSPVVRTAASPPPSVSEDELDNPEPPQSCPSSSSSALSDPPELALPFPSSPTPGKSLSPASLFDEDHTRPTDSSLSRSWAGCHGVLVRSSPPCFESTRAAKCEGSQKGYAAETTTQSLICVASEASSPSVERTRRRIKQVNREPVVLTELGKTAMTTTASRGRSRALHTSADRKAVSHSHNQRAGLSQCASSALQSVKTIGAHKNSGSRRSSSGSRANTPPTSPQTLEAMMTMSQARPGPPSDCPGRSVKHQIESRVSDRPAGMVRLAADGSVETYLAPTLRIATRPGGPSSLRQESRNTGKEKEPGAQDHTALTSHARGRTDSDRPKSEELEDDVVFEMLRGYSRKRRRRRHQSDFTAESDEELDGFFRSSPDPTHRPRHRAHSLASLARPSEDETAARDGRGNSVRSLIPQGPVQSQSSTSLAYHLPPAQIPENMKSYFRRKDREEAHEGGSPTKRKSRELLMRRRSMAAVK
ncbi:unnamed protein product [Parajaminaea phylloscopi]